MITVVGYKGVVGGATYRLFKNLGYPVVGVDKGDGIPESDLYFICVPEANVEDVVKETPYYGLIVIRSSVPPLTTETLSMKYHRHICHNPEFLHQAVALVDAHNPDSIVIGQCCDTHGLLIEELYKPLCKPIIRTSPRVSEMVKLARNNYGATIISFWNEIDRICKEADINAYQVGMICNFDPIVNAKGSRLHGPYGGACLPKDIKQTIDFARKLGVKPVLLEAVEEVNNDLTD
jgi:UDPglucose 6-dehydrogenase